MVWKADVNIEWRDLDTDFPRKVGDVTIGDSMEGHFDESEVGYDRNITSFVCESSDTLQGEINWCTGSAIVALVLSDGIFIPMVFRDADAPVYSESLGTCGGMSDTIDQALEPQSVIAREVAEELIIVDQSREAFLRPALYNYITEKELDAATDDIFDLWRDYIGSDFPIVDVKSSLLRSGNDTIQVTDSASGKTNIINTYLAVDPRLQVGEVRDLVIIDIPHINSDDIVLFDGGRSMEPY